MEPGMKRCPYCDEIIRANAIKCRYCGSLLTDAPASGAITDITLVKQALVTRYELQEEIGKGGMATVYKAIQKNLQRPVALKVIHQNLIHDSEFVARFHREAQVCASLQHHNIVTVYDEGELNGVHFMAMELLNGYDLHQLIHRQGKLSVEQTLKWVTPIAEALSYAHHKGIIHRDIKSSNILITQSGRSVLMDFGIAHAASGTKLTQTGMVIGTPEYMSPEQAEGKSIDHRTDIYSLGIVLYECLTGKVPFKADNPLSIIMKVVNEAPVPPIEYNNQIPAWLNRTILQCLAKSPEERFADAEALAHALAKAQAPVSGPPKKRSKGSPKPQAGSQQPPPNIRKMPPQKKQRKGSGLKTFAWLLFILLLILAGVYGVNYYQQKEAAKEAEYALYSNVKSKNTQQAYTQYLNTYPNGTHSYEIRQKLETLQQEQVTEQKRAAAKKAEYALFSEVLSKNTQQAYTQYLNTYPNGVHSNEVRQKLEELKKEQNLLENGFTDTRDGHHYNVVKIGDQIWMAENLEIGKMINFGSEETDNGVIEKYCYNNDPKNCEIYGGLYYEDEMMNYTYDNTSKHFGSKFKEGAQGICPNGWHIPSKSEWDYLIKYLGGRDIAGGKLKEAGYRHWSLPNTGATNESGFTALPGGGSFMESSDDDIIGKRAYFYTSTTDPEWDYGKYGNFMEVLYYKSKSIEEVCVGDDGEVASVRCIKNSDNNLK